MNPVRSSADTRTDWNLSGEFASRLPRLKEENEILTSNGVKTILTNVSNSFFIRNILRSGALKVLEESGDVKLVLLAPRHKLEYYRRQFPAGFIEFDAMPEIRRNKLEKFFKFLETSSIHSHTAYMLSKSNLHRAGTQMPLPRRYAAFFVRTLLWQLGRFRAWRNFLRLLYNIFPNKAFDPLLEKYKPELVFLPSLIYPEDYVLGKAAKKRGIKTLGMTLSWDNFYSKTMLLVKPDYLLVHTDKIKEQAKKFGDWKGGHIYATGIPQYDRYFRKEDAMSRDEFFKKIGADSKKKLILYAFSGKAGLNIEFSVLEALYEVIKNSGIGEAEVLLRPYPRYDFSKDKLDEFSLKYKFLSFQPVSHPARGRDNWEFDEDSLKFLYASLLYSDIVITMYSTFFIEAAIFNKPLIAIAFDGKIKLDYWNSARRFFDWDHLAELHPLEGIKIVRNREELTEAIKSYLRDPGIFSAGRKKIVLEQCQFTDGKSGERVAKTILEVLGLQ